MFSFVLTVGCFAGSHLVLGQNNHANVAVDIDQCANGSSGTVSCSGSAWINGNLNGNTASWVEGQSVPYRFKISNLTVGVPTTVTIGWDTTVNNGKHGVDYLRTYDVSAPGADPCTDFLGAGNCANFSTFVIPVDGNVTNGQDGLLGTSDDITQKPGVFTLWGGTITGTSGYTLTGDYSSASETQISVSFTPSASTAVLAWSGHISTRDDWGLANSAGEISGSPYHMRNRTGGGNQDRAMQTDTITYIGRVTVVKIAIPVGGNQASTVPGVPFSFMSSIAMGGVIPGTITVDTPSDETTSNGFSLTDDSGADKATTATILFGSNITIDETSQSGWNLVSMNCVSSIPNSSNTISGSSLNTTLVLAESEYVTCTSTSNQIAPTSSRVSVTGEVLTPQGRPIVNAIVSFVDLVTGE